MTFCDMREMGVGQTPALCLHEGVAEMIWSKENAPPCPDNPYPVFVYIICCSELCNKL